MPPSEHHPNPEELAQELQELARLLHSVHRHLPALIALLRNSPDGERNHRLARAWDALEHALALNPTPPGPYEVALAVTAQGWSLAILDGLTLTTRVQWEDIVSAAAQAGQGSDPKAVERWMDYHLDVLDLVQRIGAREEDFAEAIRMAVNEVRATVLWTSGSGGTPVEQ